jgi:hypothetical protein
MQMEIAVTALASKALAILTPYVSKGAEELTKSIGEAGYAKAKQLFEKIKDKFNGDKKASDTLSDFEKAPEAKKQETEAVLAEALAKDENFARSVDTLVKEIGPLLMVFQDMDKGVEVTGADVGQLNRGRVVVEQRIKDGQNITGAKIDKMG